MKTAAKSKELTLMDCTLRDGGYYNDWNFSMELARSLVRSLTRAGIDIIEMGYKSPKNHRSQIFEGLFRFCPESQLGFLKDYPQAEYAFMLDAKEFISDQKIDPELVKESILPQSESVFTWARIATHPATYKQAVDLALMLGEMGYKVTINLMGITMISREKVVEALKSTPFPGVDVFYFADSFGSMSQEEVTGYISLIREHYKGKVGLHTHDNQGLAFANTLTAMEEKVDFIDSTIMGMGRGAGNLKTEQLLPYLYFKDQNYRNLNPAELLDVIDQYFAPIHTQYQWGWDYTYMLSALENIHPTYCQSLRSTKQYTIEQINDILNRIEPEKRKSYNDRALLAAIDTAVNAPIETLENLEPVVLYEPAQTREFLIIATGPYLSNHKAELIQFIEQYQPVVIECNPQNKEFEQVSKQYLRCILNWVRLQNNLLEKPQDQIPVITGIQAVPESLASKANLFQLPCHVDKETIRVTKTGITIPAYVVGMFAVAAAMLSQPEKIYLAGFDGYSDQSHPKHLEMNLFWHAVLSQTDFVSLTPSTYPLPIQSIYGLIQ